MIGILDYGMGNIKSVENAIDWEGFEPVVVTDKAQFDELTHLIVPGVGAFDVAMHNMNKSMLLQPLMDFIDSGRPVLGICLGMQLLASVGQEGDGAKGLDIVPGEVMVMKPDGLPVPHVGWNSLELNFPHPVFEGIKDHVDFYFVHSYAYQVENQKNVIASTEYGGRFPSVVGCENVVGMQFHPEKSQENGLALLRNFCLWDGLC